MDKLIITVAPVGPLPKKEDTPYVPITPEEIINDVVECYEAGAAVAHIHARDEDENSIHDIELFKKIHDGIKERAPDMIVQISTGGRAGLNFESRSKGLFVNPEMASLTTGSCNFPTSIYENSPSLIRDLLNEMNKRKIKPELEIFDTSMIDQAIQLEKENMLQKPLYFNFVMGLKNCQPATIDHIAYLLNRIPEGSIWNISGVGRAQLMTTFMSIPLGGHVRVGLEDNIYYTKGKLGKNSDMVKRVVRLANEYNRSVATPDEAREILGLN